MDFYFFPDVYADRQLIDYYVITFKLRSTDSVQTRSLEGREYIVGIKDWESFKKSAYDIVLYEFGDEIDKFDDIETALKSAYSMAYAEASRLSPKSIQPAMGYGNPPIDVILKVFPTYVSFEPFPEDIESYLDKVIKDLTEETMWSDADDED